MFLLCCTPKSMIIEFMAPVSWLLKGQKECAKTCMDSVSLSSFQALKASVQGQMASNNCGIQYDKKREHST